METTEQKSNSEEILLRCCTLRQKIYHLLQKSLQEESREYDKEMKRLHAEVDKLMAQLD